MRTDQLGAALFALGAALDFNLTRLTRLARLAHLARH
jgi:hypothetical protein